MSNPQVEEAQQRYFVMLAARAHEANRILSAAIGETVQPVWKDAPEEQRDGIVKGVRFLYDNPGTSPASLHTNWLKDKLANGWRWGHTKSADKKEHPNMVPYEELSREQQMKDYLFYLCVTGKCPELPRNESPQVYRCGPQLVNAVARMISDVNGNVSHNRILINWDSNRGVDWFKGA